MNDIQGNDSNIFDRGSVGNRIMKIMKGKKDLIIFLFFVLLVAIVSTQFWDMSNDDAYTTFRYARNVLESNGFVFNPGERVLATTAPFQAMILVIIGMVFPAHIPLAANILSSLMLWIMCWFGYLFFKMLGYWKVGLVGGILLALQIWTYAFFPLETILVMGLEFLTLYFYITGRLRLAAMSIAMAVLTRYDAGILLIVLGIHYLVSQKPLKKLPIPAAIFSGLVIPWLFFARWYFGSIFPNTVAAKTGISHDPWIFINLAWEKIFLPQSLVPSISIAILAIAGVSLFFIPFDQQRKALWILPVWGISYITAYSLIQLGSAHTWYYYPLVVISLYQLSYAWLKIEAYLLRKSPTSLKIAAKGLLVALLLVLFTTQTVKVSRYWRNHPNSVWSTRRESAYINCANWLRENTPLDARVAMTEIGTVGYYADRTIVDLLGLATPSATETAKIFWPGNIDLLQPDYVVIQNRYGDPPNDTSGMDTLTIQGRAFNPYKLVHSLDDGYYLINIYQRIVPKTDE